MTVAYTMTSKLIHVLSRETLQSKKEKKTGPVPLMVWKTGEQNAEQKSLASSELLDVAEKSIRRQCSLLGQRRTAEAKRFDQNDNHSPFGANKLSYETALDLIESGSGGQAVADALGLTGDHKI